MVHFGKTPAQQRKTRSSALPVAAALLVAASAGSAPAAETITPLQDGQLSSLFQTDVALHYADNGEIVEAPYEQFFKSGKWTRTGVRPRAKGQYRLEANRFCVVPNNNGPGQCRQIGRAADGRLFLRSADGLPGWLGIAIAPATP